MNTTELMQILSYILMAIGALAFITSVIVQVIKEMPKIKEIPTNVVVFAVALILCPIAVILACTYLKMPITWYYVLASFIAAFIVYLVSTGGWERVTEIWNRTKYKDTEGE